MKYCIVIHLSILKKKKKKKKKKKVLFYYNINENDQLKRQLGFFIRIVLLLLL